MQLFEKKMQQNIMGHSKQVTILNKVAYKMKEH
jgi:hypothetical protein